MILSGMSNFEQLQQNIAFFDEKKMLNDDDLATLLTAAHFETTGKSAGTVPCTACKYCTTKCPQELNIPRLLALYNEHAYSEGGFIAPMVIGTLPESKRPAACIGCQSCEAVCPQQIKISDMMKDFASKVK
jgi:predicted aldo/keto reductase-like oxidoreductase